MCCDATIVALTCAPRGLIAEHGTSWMLPKLVGASNALDMNWSSPKINGEEAFRLGYPKGKSVSKGDWSNLSANVQNDDEATNL